MIAEDPTLADPQGYPQLRPPPRNRMVVAVLALIGLFVALYLLAYSVGLVPLVCGISQCETVQMSEWAKVGGVVPVPALGVLGYVSILGLAMLGIQPSRAESRGIGLLMLGLATVGVAYSGFLTYLEANVINAWCVWCIISAVLMTLIFLFSLPELRRGT
jgi:uncharacterized membrane protein